MDNGYRCFHLSYVFNMVIRCIHYSYEFAMVTDVLTMVTNVFTEKL